MRACSRWGRGFLRAKASLGPLEPELDNTSVGNAADRRQCLSIQCARWRSRTQCRCGFFFARSRAMRVILNGEEQEIRDDITVAELLQDLQIVLQHGAVAVNRRVVRKKDHEATYLQAGDRIEIVRPAGGG